MVQPTAVLDDHVLLRLPSSWVAEIDLLRGTASRAHFLRGELQRVFRQQGHPLPVPASRRGKYSRRERGMLNSKTLAKLEEREHRTESRRHRQPKPKEAPAVIFTFSPSGNVGASDLSDVGVDAGHVFEFGVYESTSRHGAAEVQAALRQQMAAEPGRAWPARYLRFAQREL